MTPMNFTNFFINPVPMGHVEGKGEDEVGKFELKGSFNQNSTAVRFKKQYIGMHAIYYEG